MKKLVVTTAIITSLFALQQEAKSQATNIKNSKIEATVKTEKAAIEKLILT